MNLPRIEIAQASNSRPSHSVGARRKVTDRLIVTNLVSVAPASHAFPATIERRCIAAARRRKGDDASVGMIAVEGVAEMQRVADAVDRSAGTGRAVWWTPSGPDGVCAATEPRRTPAMDQLLVAPAAIHDLIVSIVAWSRNGPPSGIRWPLIPAAPSSF